MKRVLSRGMVAGLLLALFVLVLVAGVIGGGLTYVYARGRVLPGVSARRHISIRPMPSIP